MLDVFTLRVASAVMVLLTSSLFLVHSWVRRGALVDRLWMLALVAAFASAVLSAGQALVPDHSALVAAGNALTVLVPWAAWSGARAGVGKPPLLWVSLAVAGVVAIAALVDGDAGTWAGGGVYIAGVAGGSLAGGWEVLNGPLARFRSGVGLGVVLLSTAIYHGVRLLFFLASGPDGRFFRTLVGTEVSTLALATSVLGSAFFMVGLRSDQGVAELPGGTRYDPLTGARPARIFVRLAARALGAGAQRGLPMCLVRLQIDETSAIRTAFGDSRAEEANAVCGDVVHAVAPPHTIVGLEEAGNGFEVLLEAASVDGGRRWAEDLCTALLDHPVGVPGASLRLVASVGVACTDACGYDLSALRRAAGSALATAQQEGGDRVVTAS